MIFFRHLTREREPRFHSLEVRDATRRRSQDLFLRVSSDGEVSYTPADPRPMVSARWCDVRPPPPPRAYVTALGTHLVGSLHP
jgi:hypothetical protein